LNILLAAVSISSVVVDGGGDGFGKVVSAKPTIGVVTELEKLEKTAIESLNVPEPTPATVTVTDPPMSNTPVAGLMTFNVFTLAIVSVTRALLNDVPPRLPLAVTDSV
jgi:hypothetical protein